MSFSIFGWFVGLSRKTYVGGTFAYERIDVSAQRPGRRYRARALWLGPLCIISRGQFSWEKP